MVSIGYSLKLSGDWNHGPSFVVIQAFAFDTSEIVPRAELAQDRIGLRADAERADVGSCGTQQETR